MMVSFGPGMGTFWTMAFMLGFGFNMTRATGYTKVMNFASNVSSLAVFSGWQCLVLRGFDDGSGPKLLRGASSGTQVVISG